jgi:hypothetical protein
LGAPAITNGRRIAPTLTTQASAALNASPCVWWLRDKLAHSLPPQHIYVGSILNCV